MAEIKLFRLGEEVRELQAESARIESDLQNLIENNMEKFFGVRFLAHEYASGDVRMDSVGLDENNCPVIFEYKRRKDQNVITQGLCYLNRLFARKDEFNSLVAEKIENFDAAEIDWSMPRIICIASSYGKYDCEAIKNLNRNISLITYKKYGGDLIVFELAATNTVAPVSNTAGRSDARDFSKLYDAAPQKLKDLFDELKAYALGLGDDVSGNELKVYYAFRKIRNFCTIQVQKTKILVNLKLNPDEFALSGELRDIRDKGHLGCGEMQFILRDKTRADAARELIFKAYENS